MNKFTPGPWFVDHKSPFLVRAGDDIDGRHIAHIGPANCTPRFDVDEPNAKLIAAAPDLLEALEALADSAPSACCVDFHHKPGDYHDADESCPALDRYEDACLSARAAIARARGEA